MNGREDKREKRGRGRKEEEVEGEREERGRGIQQEVGNKKEEDQAER